MTQLFRTIIGSNHGKPHSRIWIEGARLSAAGFKVGDLYDRIIEGQTLILRRAEKGRYKVSGKADKPIIDITGSLVATLFPQPTTHVLVTYAPQIITITAAPCVI